MGNKNLLHQIGSLHKISENWTRDAKSASRTENTSEANKKKQQNNQREKETFKTTNLQNAINDVQIKIY